jgi:P27 family predicted phage terminase small subunit
LPRETGFERAPECPDPPPFLDAYARDEWWRIAPGLFVMGMLSVVDVHPFAAYCAAYSRWRAAEEAIALMAKRDELTKAMLIKAADGTPRTNPLIRISADSASDMVRFASEFGFTAAARARIASGISAPPTGSKFDGLLARKSAVAGAMC